MITKEQITEWREFAGSVCSLPDDWRGLSEYELTSLLAAIPDLLGALEEAQAENARLRKALAKVVEYTDKFRDAHGASWARCVAEEALRGEK